MKTADEIRAEEEAAEVEDYTPSAVCLRILAVELAHREAIAEDNERDARDWSAFCAQVAVRKAAEVREQSDMEE